MPIRRTAAAVLCCATLAAACSGDDSSIDPEADEDLIEDVILTVDDLPDGFEESDAGDDDSNTFDACNEDILGIDRDAIEDATTAETDDVVFDGDGVNIRVSVSAFEDGDDITRIVEALEDDDYLDCLAEALEDELDAGQALQDLEEIDSPFEDDDAVIGAAAIFLEIDNDATSGIVLDVESQQHLVVVDRFGISLQVTGETGQIDDDLVTDALEAMVERLRDGLD